MNPYLYFTTEKEWFDYHEKSLREAYEFITSNIHRGIFENLKFEDFVKKTYCVFSSKRKLPS
jgi:hypothetical protein